MGNWSHIQTQWLIETVGRLAELEGWADVLEGIFMLSHVQLFATLWTTDCQVPLSVGILPARIVEWVPRLEEAPRDLPDPGVESGSPVSPALPVYYPLSRQGNMLDVN